MLLLRPPDDGLLRAATWLVAAGALVFPRAARAAVVWLVLAALVAARVAFDWPLADNHIYLLGYWCLGVGLCLAVARPFEAIAAMSRWLVGAVFTCAIVWKGVLAPDFLDARFFRMTLITDTRFEDVSRTIGGLTDVQLQGNRDALAALPAGADVLGGPVLIEPPALRRLGLALTWGGFSLESVLALAFLSRRPAVVHRSRHALLIAFGALTYAIAPVAGFGWLLAAMGLAQCERRQWIWRLAYTGVFALVAVYSETPLMSYVLTAL